MQPYVDIYFVARWQRPGQPLYNVTDILTKPVVNIFFTKQGAFINAVTRGTRKFIIDSDGVYAGIKFKPGGFRAFMKQPVCTLTNTIPLSTVFTDVNEAALDEIVTIKDDQQLVLCMENILRLQRPSFDVKIELAGRAVGILEDDPDVSVTELASLLHKSERGVQYLFSEYIGANIKWTSMRFRLLKALQKPLTEQKPHWTEIAAELNYSTHSHFVNDFRRLLGVSPSEYIKLLHSIE